jgi:hypothetical protein
LIERWSKKKLVFAFQPLTYGTTEEAYAHSTNTQIVKAQAQTNILTTKQKSTLNHHEY